MVSKPLQEVPGDNSSLSVGADCSHTFSGDSSLVARQTVDALLVFPNANHLTTWEVKRYGTQTLPENLQEKNQWESFYCGLG